MWREGILMIVRRYLETPALLLIKKKKKEYILSTGELDPWNNSQAEVLMPTLLTFGAR